MQWTQRSILLSHVEDKVVMPCEVYSRVVGYIRPVAQWNVGKLQEWKDRNMYNKSLVGRNSKGEVWDDRARKREAEKCLAQVG
jgi:hypothetical protein